MRTHLPFLHKEANSYDFLLFLLIASIAFGGIGGGYQVVRIMAAVFAPALFLRIGKSATTFVIFFAFWYAYNLISLVWTPNLEQAAKELAYYPLHFLLFLEIVCFAKKANRCLSSITTAWVFALICTMGVALWEITTDNHLSMSVQDADAMLRNGVDMAIQHNFASVTFGNYNCYCVFICFCFPFIFYTLGRKHIGSIKSFLLFLTPFVATYIVLMNASRGSLVTLGIILVVYLYYSFKIGHDRDRGIAILAFIVIVVSVYFFADNAFEAIRYRLEAKNLIDTDDSRIYIWRDALALSTESLGIGTGVGSLHAAMQGVRAHGSITATHNFFMELLLQYGFVIFAGVVVFIVSLFRRALKADYRRKVVLMSALLPLPFSLSVNSGYLLEPMVWGFFASVFVFAVTEEEEDDEDEEDADEEEADDDVLSYGQSAAEL